MAGANSTELHTHNDIIRSPVLIWLDASVNGNEKNKQTQQDFQSIIYNFRAFEDPNQCQKYISSVPSHGRIVLITSGQFGRQLVPQIHNLQQLLSIYVYCMDKEANEAWAKNFTKV
jgi:hypothetical protein